ncbi:carboxymuconolactone decarboxylase family protein [Arhodomonas aquaeolei]|uniref:carboxymuconolactone decarboxylase family protein n=1 Tax=Arhodomonas TaxID=2368 RepID=UPI000A076980|nr:MULTISPECIES: carboxymuconolactone decarboxylase family protein [Arhodomonas]MCS4504444.1 carboxymuconolactone decarboxylase family protein [Arhodomonas aquaeolei]
MQPGSRGRQTGPDRSALSGAAGADPILYGPFQGDAAGDHGDVQCPARRRRLRRCAQRQAQGLIALAIPASDGWISFHTHDSVKAGASPEGLAEALSVADLMGGGPAMLYATRVPMMEAMA